MPLLVPFRATFRRINDTIQLTWETYKRDPSQRFQTETKTKKEIAPRQLALEPVRPVQHSSHMASPTLDPRLCRSTVSERIVLFERGFQLRERNALGLAAMAMRDAIGAVRDLQGYVTLSP